MNKRYIKYNERCRTNHVGSSTCAGCDPDYWILTEEEEQFQKEQQSKETNDENSSTM